MTRAWHHWTSAQLKKLAVLWPVATKEQLVEQLAPHPYSSIKRRASMLGLRKQSRQSKHRDWMAICDAHKPCFVFVKTLDNV